MSIGVAVLGGGIFAREEHIPAIQASKDLQLLAVWSRSLKSAESVGADVKDLALYSEDSGEGKSLDDLLARTDIKAVTIALPIKNQPEYIRKALLAGKHVLSEKPVAENIKDAKQLIQWYNTEIKPKNVTWGVAENFRYLNSFNYAAEGRKKLGKTIGFRLRMQTLVEGGKYFETDWRKVPTHQGGFLLDGGVHFTAGLRLLLGPDNPLVSISAHTSQMQEHLPPVDSIEATAKAKNGAIGSISLSFGTTHKGSEWTIACQEGIASVSGSKVTLKGETTDVEDERSGVPPEIRYWGQALAAGKTNESQSPEEALADLEIIEACLQSGEQDGKAIKLQCQTW